MIFLAIYKLRLCLGRAEVCTDRLNGGFVAKSVSIPQIVVPHESDESERLNEVRSQRTGLSTVAEEELLLNFFIDSIAYFLVDSEVRSASKNPHIGGDSSLERKTNRSKGVLGALFAYFH